MRRLAPPQSRVAARAAALYRTHAASAPPAPGRSGVRQRQLPLWTATTQAAAAGGAVLAAASGWLRRPPLRRASTARLRWTCRVGEFLQTANRLEAARCTAAGVIGELRSRLPLVEVPREVPEPWRTPAIVEELCTVAIERLRSSPHVSVTLARLATTVAAAIDDSWPRRGEDGAGPFEGIRSPATRHARRGCTRRGPWPWLAGRGGGQSSFRRCRYAKCSPASSGGGSGIGLSQ